ncbi:MAG TPA: type VII secretion protein EssC [Ktedonobacterales bacterium]
MQQTRTIVTTIRDRSERVSHDLQLPGDLSISQLLPQLIKTLGLPPQDNAGHLYPYALMLRDNRFILPADQSLISLGVSSGRILLLVLPTPDERLYSAKVGSAVGAAPAASAIGPQQNGANSSASVGITFNRPPRIRVHLPSEEIELPDPPKPPQEELRLDPFTLLVPLVTFGIIVVLFLVVIPRIAPQQVNNPVFLFTLGVFAVVNPSAGILSFFFERRRIRKGWKVQQEDYRGALKKYRTKLETLRIEQHRARRATSPSVSKLKELIDERIHLWERRPDDDDFLHLRVGKTSLPSTVKVLAPSAKNATDLQEEAEQLAQEFATVADVPLTLPIPQLGSVGVAGARGPVVDFARSLICHLAIHHSPDEVRVVGIYPPTQSREWEWLKWLPHTNHFKAGNQNRMLAFTDEQTRALLNDVTEEVSRREARQAEEKEGKEKSEPVLPFVLLLIDDYNRVRDNVGLSRVLRNGRDFNIAAIVLVESRQDIPGDCGAILEVLSYEQLVYSVAGADGQVKSDIVPDRIDWGTSDLLARSLAPIQVRGSQGPGNISTSVRLIDLLKLEAADKFDPLAWWNRQGGPAFGRLNVPIGEKSGGVLYLNLHNKEHGPHGLVAGTTGSGKSVLLQSLVAALAITHHPHLMNFVLVDFKGGSAFKDFENIPHTVGMVSDLHGRLAERALIALKSELKRREQILHEANVTDIDQYQEVRARDPKRGLAPLPSLLIVIDEFAELAKELPTFMGGLISVVQKGRSLGVHLILATQRPSGVVSANISANVKFRISLRVASLDDSREMLGRADAALLPHNLPGRGFFQVGAEIFEQFQAASVASPFRPAQPREARQQAQIAELTRAGHVHDLSKSRKAADARGAIDDRSELQVLMGLMEPYTEQFSSALFRPWPDPLPDNLPLPSLFQQVGKASLDGARWEGRPAFGWLNAPIGMLDLPADQKQEVFMLDLLRQGGHLMIAGSAGSGKSFLLRTIITALALSHSPSDLNMYLIDFGGQMLRPFEKMPHVGGVFTSADSERIRRLFRKLKGIIEERKQLFRELRVDSFMAYHNRANNNNQPPPPLPAIVVILDKFAEFRAVHEQDFPDMLTFSRDGRAYGVHLIISTDRPGVVPSNLAGNLEMRYALRLADPSDSTWVLGKTDAATLDPATPGRGLRRARGIDEFQTALPVVGDSDEEQGRQIEALATRMAQAARGVRADPIQLLPEYISLPDLITQAANSQQPAKAEGLRVPLGIDDLTLRPVWGELHPDAQHFLIAGAAGTGKTALLRTWILGLAQRYAPTDVQLYVVDFRRTLRSLSRLPHVKGFADNEPRLNDLMEGLKKELLERQQRMSSGVTSKTPLVPIVLILDDYELITALPKNPGNELKDVVRQARDIGLHAIIAGSIADLGRGFDPLAQQAKAGRSGIVLGGDPQDAAILGVRIVDLPPGRGFFVQRNSRNLMQAAFLEPEAVAVWMAQIRGSGVSIKG